MKRFEIVRSTHMGPLHRMINVGDVICWDQFSRTLTINGDALEEDKGMDFKRTIDILEKQMIQDPTNPLAKELSPVNITMNQLDVKTDTQVVLPILGCLKAAEEYLEQLAKSVAWTPSNEDQYQFLKRFLAAKKFVEALGDNLKRKADKDVSVINAWLKENGFDIELGDVGGDGAFAVASILDVLVEWVKEGTIYAIYTPKGTFHGVQIKNEDEARSVVLARDRTIHPFPIAGIETKSGDRVFMSVLDFLPNDTFAITDKVEQLRKVKDDPKNHGSCGGVIFPMVNYDRRVDINWICGMTTGEAVNGWYIGQALQQTRFRMNEKGARAESAVAMTLCFKSSFGPKEMIRIDKPFILWIERPGIDIPLFTGVFAEDVWKKPAGLTK